MSSGRRWCGPEFPDWHADADGRVFRLGVEVMPYSDKAGYLRVYCHGRSEAVHTLVCTAFHGPRPRPMDTPRGWRGLGVGHCNDVKTDNRAANLCWNTHRDNARDAQRNGRARPMAWEKRPAAEQDADVAVLKAKYGID